MINQRIYIWCRVCECRLNIPEEWNSGYCVGCNQVKAIKWGDVLAHIEAAALETVPTGLITRPKRD